MFWNKKRKQEQQKWELLRQLFLEMIDSTNGSVNSIQFASYVNRKGKITLSGHESTRFLETMVEEFQGIYEPTPEGYMNYRFNCKATPQNQQSTVSSSQSASPPQSSKSSQYHRSQKRSPTQSKSSSRQKQQDESPRPSEQLEGKIKEFEGQLQNLFGNLFDNIGR